MPSRLFLHSASICAGFTTQAALGASDSNVWCVRAVAALPLQLKERLAELGGGEAAEAVDAAVRTEMEEWGGRIAGV